MKKSPKNGYLKENRGRRTRFVCRCVHNSIHETNHYITFSLWYFKPWYSCATSQYL